MKARIISLAILACTTLPALAEKTETQAFIDNQIDAGNAIRQQAAAASRPEFLTPHKGKLSELDNKWIDELQRKQQQAAGEEKPAPRALYFVSFSIPHEGLKRMVSESSRFKIPATLRGLVNNDMKQTTVAVYGLVKDSKQGGVQVDPKAFTTYGVRAVPALVVTCKKGFDRIAGNLRLEEALRQIVEKGDCSDTAEGLLKEAGL